MLTIFPNFCTNLWCLEASDRGRTTCVGKRRKQKSRRGQIKETKARGSRFGTCNCTKQATRTV